MGLKAIDIAMKNIETERSECARKQKKRNREKERKKMSV